MRTIPLLLLAAAAWATASRPAAAGWQEFWDGVDLHRQRVATWPEPFLVPDREAVRNPFRAMADNGWKQQNTFNDDLFHAETNELNNAGLLKLRQMLRELPPHRRQIFVLEAQTPEATSVRVASVYKSLAQVMPDQRPCPVMTTRVPAAGGEGWYLYGVENTYRSSLPAPRMPNPASAASSPGGGATPK